VCFGTLVQRSAKSRVTIEAFLRNTRPDCVRIFDVNLWARFYSRDVIINSLALATIVKFNEAEFGEIGSMVGLAEADAAESLPALARNFDLQLVCLTRGSRGSLLATPDHAVEHPGFAVEVNDTIGAGDAFTAAVAHGWLSKGELEKTSAIADRWAAWVASQPGGMPLLDEQQRHQMPYDIGQSLAFYPICYESYSARRTTSACNRFDPWKTQYGV
jgi:fructokinase